MKKGLILGLFTLMLLSTGIVFAGPFNKRLGQGWSQYATIKVDWDGNLAHAGSWNVYAGPYYVTLHPSYTVDQFVTGCAGGGTPSSCLDMSSYNFVFIGNTLQFDEVYVLGVDAFPQTHHVVLQNDGTGVYTGSITARYDYPGSSGGPTTVTRMDVIKYTVTTSGGTVTGFHYDEVEYVQTNVVA